MKTKNAENYPTKKGNKFWGLNIAMKILKNRIRTWNKGDTIGFGIGRKHFTIVRDE